MRTKDLSVVAAPGDLSDILDIEELPAAVANGSALRLGAGETKTFWLTASLVEEA